MKVMLCKKSEWRNLRNLPSNWVLEIKYDGMRATGEKEGRGARLISREGKDKSHIFPEIIEEMETYPFDFTNDGEVVGGDILGGNFYELAERIHLADEFRIKLLSRIKPCRHMVFHVLSFDHQDLRRKPLKENREFLRYFHGTNIRPVESYSLDELINMVEEGEIEGIVAKNPNSFYEPKRSSNWLKFKREWPEDLLILGYVLDGDEIHSLILEKGNKEIYVSQGLSDIDRRRMPRIFGSSYREGSKVYLENPIYAEVSFYKHLGTRIPIFRRLKIDK